MLTHSQNIHPKVQSFLDTVGNQIHTEAEATAIKSEMLDHIETAKEDYIEASYSETEALSKALKDMGDPAEIGYAFTNFNIMRRRNAIRLTLKSTGFLLLLAVIGTIVYSEATFSPEDWIEIFASSSYLIIYYYVLKAALSLRADRTIKDLDIETKPLFIVWPVKKPVEVEYKLLAFIFSPIFIIFIWLYFHEAIIEGNLLQNTLIFAAFAISGTLVIYSEAFRIPKTVIVSEGIVLKGKLLSWTAINRFKFVTVKTKTGVYYKLQLLGLKHIAVGPTIILSEKQKPFVAQLLSERI